MQHKYAPTNPSPLAKVLKTAGDSSSEDLEASLLRRSFKGKAKAVDFGVEVIEEEGLGTGEEGSGGQSGVWVPFDEEEEVLPSPPPFVKRKAKEVEPLTEEDLTMLPKSSSKSSSAPAKRPSQIAKGPIRPVAVVKKGKEKENLAPKKVVPTSSTMAVKPKVTPTGSPVKKPPPKISKPTVGPMVKGRTLNAAATAVKR